MGRQPDRQIGHLRRVRPMVIVEHRGIEERHRSARRGKWPDTSVYSRGKLAVFISPGGRRVSRTVRVVCTLRHVFPILPSFSFPILSRLTLTPGCHQSRGRAAEHHGSVQHAVHRQGHGLHGYRVQPASLQIVPLREQDHGGGLHRDRYKGGSVRLLSFRVRQFALPLLA